MPRSKQAVHTEAHLKISSHAIESLNFAPSMYTGSLDMLGLADNKVIKIGELGESQYRFERRRGGGPEATLTTGYGTNRSNYVASGDRFGDPHAIYNPYAEVVQVCGFIALSPELGPDHVQLFDSLRAAEPTKLNDPLFDFLANAEILSADYIQ